MTTTTQSEAVERASRVRVASRRLATTPAGRKNAALEAIADALEAESDAILAVNGPELERAERNGISGAFLDRMTLTPERIASMAGDVRAVAALPDPVGGDRGPADAPQRPTGGAHARAARRDRRDLRGAPQRDDRYRLGLP